MNPVVLLKKCINTLKTGGAERVRQKIRSYRERKEFAHEFSKRRRPDATELAAQRAERFSRSVRFSLLVPLYNTPESFLREMIDSVRAQSYEDWELCLADGSDDAHACVAAICREYAAGDARIQYRKLEENGGISANTNVCLAMATGEYLALLDHDDLLEPSALYEVMRAICGQNPDFIYTDEMSFQSPNRDQILSVHFKPDFAPDDLLARNYICHFTVFARSLLEKTGAFRPEYDGAQDFDLILRLTEQAERIVHIPQVLYGWRAHPQSTAQNLSSKGGAAEAGRRAVAAALQRRGWSGTVECSPVSPLLYRVRLEVQSQPKIAVILADDGNLQTLLKSVEAVRSSSFGNLELLVACRDDEEIHLRMLRERLGQIPLLAGKSKAQQYNRAADQSDAEFLVFLSAGTVPLEENWLEELLPYAQREDVGAVGGLQLDEKGRIVQAGLGLGLGPEGLIGALFQGQPADAEGYMQRLCYARNSSLLSGEGLMVRAAVFHTLGGFDETLSRDWDLDFSLKLQEKGLLLVWTPHVRLTGESKGRGPAPEEEIRRFTARWAAALQAGDPYYNPNFEKDVPYSHLRKE